MPKHRPIAARRADLLKQLSALSAKENAEAINESPRIKEIDKRVKEINNSMLKFNRWNTEWQAKVADFNARVQEWKTRGATAKNKISEANLQLAALKAERKTLAETLATKIEQGDSQEEGSES
jgi:chromosome segregation ATPase